MGIRAEWKYNKRGLAKKVGVGLAVGAVAWALLKGGKADAED
jgi:hypothetical protein